MSKPAYDKFYTKEEVAKKCIDYIDSIESFDSIIEPSAGSGVFVKMCLERFNGSIYGFDIEPEIIENHTEQSSAAAFSGIMIAKADFLTIPVDTLNKGENILVLGNPPFGRQNSLAIKFFNHCSNIRNVSCIAFILPKSFRKESIQNKLNSYFHLEKELEIPEYGFEYKDCNYNIPCVFQIWIRKSKKRPETQIEILESKKFEFIKMTQPTDFVRGTTKPFNQSTDKVGKDENNNIISIRRVGFYAGKAKRYENENIQSHYFLKAINNEVADMVINYLNTINWTFNNSVGPRSISKQEFIRELNRRERRKLK
jgi:predicted RNA methylase